MENKKVGGLTLGIAAAIALVVWGFNYSLEKIISETCTHGIDCVMYKTSNAQLFLGLAIVVVVATIGLYIMFSKPDEKIVIKKVKERPKKLNLSKLDEDERKTIQLIQSEGNAAFQKNLMEKLGIGKVKMTRLLDKLEAKQFIIRKRRGMNNIVVLKTK